jgi:hypothetical protein
VTDNTTGNSNLDLTITESKNLDFGDVATSNLMGGVRNTTDGSTSITSSDKWDEIQGSSVTSFYLKLLGSYSDKEGVRRSSSGDRTNYHIRKQCGYA